MEAATSKTLSIPKSAIQRIQLITRGGGGGLDWKLPLIGISFLSTVLMGLVLAKQWNYAAVGRNVTNDVVKFLEYHGSTKKKGVIQGGMLQSPMTVSAATTQIVARVLSVMNRIVEEEEKKELTMRAEEESARFEEEKNKTKPKLCYDAPKLPAGKPTGTATTSLKHDKGKGGKKKPKPSSLSRPASTGMVMHGAASSMATPGNQSEPESGAESGAESAPRPGTRPKQLFDPIDTRKMNKDQPEVVIEPYTPPTPMLPPAK